MRTGAGANRAPRRPCVRARTAPQPRRARCTCRAHHARNARPPHAATAMCQNGNESLYLGTALGANYNVLYENFGRKDSDMYQTRKIGVVGQGHVGAHVANSLLLQGIADELYLCDINETKVTSEVQDLRDSLSFVPYNTKIVDCGDRYEELACCDIVVNAAGKVALAATNRDGELFYTTDAARTFANRIVDAGFDGIFVSISNPCDVVCTEIWHLTGYDPKKIIGSGCGLDSARLRTEISKQIGISPKSIDAYMVGEHGFSQIGAFKAATIAGKKLSELEVENPEKYAFDHMKIEELARKGGYVTYAGKQCTEYAVANSAARVCAAVLHNEHAVLSASTLMTGQYGEEDIFTSLPCVIGAEGVEEVYTLDLSEHELEGFHKSCQHIRDNIAQLDWWDGAAWDAK